MCTCGGEGNRHHFAYSMACHGFLATCLSFLANHRCTNQLLKWSVPDLACARVEHFFRGYKFVGLGKKRRYQTMHRNIISGFYNSHRHDGANAHGTFYQRCIYSVVLNFQGLLQISVVIMRLITN